MTSTYDVPVLIVGGGRVGLSASVLLSCLGLCSPLVEWYPGKAPQPRARGVSVRTMEIMRPWGIEGGRREAAVPLLRRPTMYPREHGATPRASEMALPGDEFTADEVARLVALRQHFQTFPDHGDADAAVRRLEFARWLVQHGRLNEGLAQNDTWTRQLAE